MRAEEEGAPVTLEAGFDADEVKLVGDVKGAPPYTGVLRHRGWRATRARAAGARWAGTTRSVLAPGGGASS